LIAFLLIATEIKIEMDFDEKMKKVICGAKN
jgi:hypothetical protein